MLHATELATATQYHLALIVCVFNDGGYGVLRNLQSREFNGRYVDTDLGFIDFAQAMNHEGPYLINIDRRELTPMQGRILPTEQSS